MDKNGPTDRTEGPEIKLKKAPTAYGEDSAMTLPVDRPKDEYGSDVPVFHSGMAPNSMMEMPEKTIEFAVAKKKIVVVLGG